MGYATGKELFYGNCHLQPTLWECTQCCLSLGAGLPHDEQAACVDLCIEKFNQANADQPLAGTISALTELAGAAEVISVRATGDFVAFNHAKNLIRACRHSKHERVKSLADGLYRDLKLGSMAEI